VGEYTHPTCLRWEQNVAPPDHSWIILVDVICSVAGADEENIRLEPMLIGDIAPFG
jgi:hypothetical protein